MTAVDWIAIVIVVFAALGGATQGFVWSGLSLAGLLVGAVVGGRLAPVLLSGGSKSPYAPVLALAGAVTLAVTFAIVVTAAHVIAGETDTTIAPLAGGVLRAEPIAFDARNDIALLRVPGLGAQPLRLVDPRPGTSVAIVGYPQNGPLDAVPGRIGS